MINPLLLAFSSDTLVFSLFNNSHKCAALFVPNFSCYLVISRCIPTLVGSSLSNFLSTNSKNITSDGRNITAKDVENGNM